jgi:hypothetical protein
MIEPSFRVDCQLVENVLDFFDVPDDLCDAAGTPH